MRRKIKKILSKILTNTYSMLYNKGLRTGCKVNGFSKFNGREEFGYNVNFNGCAIYGNGKVKFGDNFHSAKGLKILTSYHNYEGVSIPYDHTSITKNVTIKDNVWIGLNVIILGGVLIEEGAIVQAGSVVVKDIPKYGICGGSPAQVFSKRDSEHYEKLKREKRFL